MPKLLIQLTRFADFRHRPTPPGRDIFTRKFPVMSILQQNFSAATVAKPQSANLQLCFHCHDECPDNRLHLEEKYFCCEGCQMVYEILNTNDLCQYYTLDERPGNSQKSRRDAHAFAWLDDPEVQAKLIRFTDGSTTRTEFFIPGMHCASCIWLLEHLYRLDNGLTFSKVNFLKKTVAVSFDATKTSLRKIAAMLSGIGYPPEINLADVENERAPAVEKALFYKIGIAGFAFGNIMLMSFPEYLGLETRPTGLAGREGEDGKFFGIFGYLNLLLALPVLLYSARDYFVSAWQGLKNRHLNLDVPLALGMVFLFGRSAWEILGGTGAGYLDSFAGLLFFLLTGKWFQQKTYHHLSFERDYKSYFPVAATVKTQSGEVTRPVSKLEPGDIIFIKNEELVPADGILLKGRARVDYSFVTGEADPVAVLSGERIFAGGKQVGETIEISVTRRVHQSYLTQLWNDEAFKTTEKSHAALLADRAGRYFTGLILGIGGAAFIYWQFFRGETGTAINAFTAVLIIACPCAVALSIPFTMGNVLRYLGRNRFYFKNTRVLEALSTVKAVVFDKTGTLTKLDVGRGTLDFGRWIANSEDLNFSEKLMVMALARQSGHPVSRQVFDFLVGKLDAGFSQALPEISNFEEKTGLGTLGKVAGKTLRLGSANFIFGNENNEKGVFLEIDGTVRGHFQFQNQYRSGMKSVVDFFKKTATVHLLSGDNDHETSNLTPIFGSTESLHFNQNPQDKLNFVKKLKESGQPVLMFGDGLNDAGALRQSDVGIVLSENTNNFTPACDAILHADEFHRLPQFFKFAEKGMSLVGRAYFLAACYNVVGLSYAVSGQLSPVVAAILMPLSSVTIIVFGTLAVKYYAFKILGNASN